ncbi:hypothetical protein L484_006540 [Morus notabilis]|uniref:Myb/SANT-like domain-containing protein n=2 Tax=Morus notabilis TaxID=981085 RepID=W9R8L2_9ROSA|nr:hypothetical protein L484_006540 [Morus notabilis]
MTFAVEESMPVSSASKANWTPAYHEVFLDLCVEETLKGNKPCSHFTREGWSNIVESFFKKVGMKYDKLQMKNHWDGTKRQWKVWLKLTTEGSLKWDPTTNKFCASLEDWANYIQANPEAAQFQFKKLQSAEKLKIIFGGDIGTEEMELATCHKRRNCCSTISVKDNEDECLYDETAPRRADKIQCRQSRTIDSEQSMSISAPRKAKVVWAPPLHKAFIDLSLEETLRGNKPGTHFTKQGWKNILGSFHKRTGLRFERLQLKNHWDNTKEQWKIWNKLVCTSCMKWDSSTKVFGANEEVWKNYIQENPEAAQFRYKELQFADKLDTIFNGAIYAGEEVPSAWHAEDGDKLIAPTLQIEKPGLLQPEVTAEHLYDPVPVESSSAAITLKNFVRAPLTQQVRLTYSIGECVDCLDGMEELEQGSDLYLFALDVFLKKEYREIFLQLKKPSLRISWLQRLQAGSQPLQ